MGVVIRYFDIAPDALESFLAVASDKQEFVDETSLSERVPRANYLTIGELNQTVLDKSQQIIPDNPTPATLGWWSKSITRADKTFENPLVLTLFSNEFFTSQGIELSFDTYNNVFATNLKITWYRDDILLSEKTFSPNKAVFYCENRVEEYNRIVITFYALNVPYSLLKISSVEHGTVRQFDSTEINQISVIKSLNPISSEIHISTLDFTLVSDKETEYIFQRKQALEVWRGDNLDGIYFVENPKKTNHNSYNIQATDYIGLLDKTIFYGGIYFKERASSVLNEMFAVANIPYEIVGDIGLKEISGHIPICTCREALMQVAFAIGAAVTTSRTDKVKIFALSDNTKHEYSAAEIGINPTIEENDRITSIQVYEHSYELSDEIKELYKAKPEEEGSRIRIEFKDPYGNLSITNGAIVESGANFAVVDVYENCVLYGKPYTHTTKVLQKNNTVANARNAQNIVRIQNATLVSAENSQSVLNRCFEYLVLNKKVNAKIITQETDVGDKVVLNIPYVGVVTGVVETMRYNLRGNTIVADTEVRA